MRNTIKILASAAQAVPYGDDSIASFCHPLYTCEFGNWEKWRAVYNGGDYFVDNYLVKFSSREDDIDFRARKKITPIPAFAKAAINEIKNSIFQRLCDVNRVGDSGFIDAAKGLNGGVDGNGSSMNWFIGEKILPELLTMKKVGVFVDSPPVGPTLADGGAKPYFYIYRAEDIRSWSWLDDNRKIDFKSVLLRNYVDIIDPDTQLSIGRTEQFRLFYINSNGTVTVRTYGPDGTISEFKETVLGIRKIPLVVFEISESLLKDVANHQIANLNLESSDVSYCLKSNVPFYIEQVDNRNGSYVKNAQQAYAQTVTQSQQPLGTIAVNQPTTPDLQSDEDIPVGGTIGRQYAKGMNAPAFIAPPTDPLRASMEKQDNLKDDIRKLMYLSLASLQPKMASAESKKFDQGGLEAGLSYIGLELEHGENRLAFFWNQYEGTKAPAEAKYPETWSIKTESDKREEIKQLEEEREKIPSNTFKRLINIQIARLLLDNKVPEDTLKAIEHEILTSKVISSDPELIIQDVQNGLLDLDTGSLARGYPEGTAEKAKKDHAERLARIAEAQAANDPGARGNPDNSVDPSASKKEKINKPKRGAGQ